METILSPGFADALLLGLSVGSVWLMAALGLTIIYGTIGVINMAHGEFIMLGAYSAYVLESKLHVPFLLCLPLSFVIVAIIGVAIERLLICHLYDRKLDTLLASWGVSLVLIQIVRLIFGSNPLYLSIPSFLNHDLRMGFFGISAFRLMVLLVTLSVSAAVWVFMQRTRFGMQIRAVTQNREMAASFGINPRKVYTGAFALGSGLAGLAGCLFGVLNIVLPNMGTQYVVQAFLVVVSGGGTLLGSVLSGAMVGEAQSIFSFFSDDTLALCLIFVLIVIFLRIRPQGLIAPTATRR
ncbi:urea ABC transporter permease subunit UrtB [Acidocella sp.]|uniref:urea ABC transporter permease subunit UrtB n=1 Tax=Acidocella sp. TaxID=50710 RepID=UPI003D02A994